MLALMLGWAGCTPKTTPAPTREQVSTIDRAALAARWTRVDAVSVDASPPVHWWEAEDTVTSNFPAADAHPFAPATSAEADMLSNGKWIGSGESTTPLLATYKVSVDRSARYRLYARKFWHHGPFSWQFDDQPWTNVPAHAALLDAVEMRPFVVANWVFAGEVLLDAGEHRFSIRLAPGTKAAAFDAFALKDGMFAPRGKRRPNAEPESAPPGWFTFDPPLDTFAETLLDQSELNRPIEEKHRLVARDGGFIRADGTRVRLWGINVSPELVALPRVELEYLARRLSKLGVNAVRIAGPVWDEHDPHKAPAPRIIEAIQHAVAVFRAHGIYTALSIYYPLWLQLDQHSPVAGYSSQHPYGLHYFNDEFDVLYRSWWRALLRAVNPHTGIRLADDPSVVLAELVNEDSTLFWTFSADNIPAGPWRAIEARFAGWLTSRYGSLASVRERWDGQMPARFTADGVELLPIATLFTNKDARAQDQARFLTEAMRHWYERTYQFLKSELDYRGSVVCSNWITASAEILGPLEKHANLACDVVDRHGYFNGLHEGDDASWQLAAGQRYAPASALTFERLDAADPSRVTTTFAHPVVDISYNDKPTIATELGWPLPNPLRADFPLTVAAYAALQDTDAVFFYEARAVDWERRLSKFTVQDPVGTGQFPAAATIYRRSLVRTGPTVVRHGIPLDRAFALEGSAVVPGLTLDQLRAADVPWFSSASPSVVDPLAALVGRVQVDIGEHVKPATKVELGEHIDHARKLVTSATGELRWDYGTGLLTIDSPSAQGVTGYLSRHPWVSTGDAEFRFDLEYGAAVMVALDDQPLARSRRILVQVASTDTNNNWQETRLEHDVRRIDKLGGPPVFAKELSGWVSIRRPDATKLRVTALDSHGYATHRMHDLSPGFLLLPTTPYYVIERLPD